MMVIFRKNNSINSNNKTLGVYRFLNKSNRRHFRREKIKYYIYLLNKDNMEQKNISDTSDKKIK